MEFREMVNQIKAAVSPVIFQASLHLLTGDCFSASWAGTFSPWSTIAQIPSGCPAVLLGHQGRWNGVTWGSPRVRVGPVSHTFHPWNNSFPCAFITKPVNYTSKASKQTKMFNFLSFPSFAGGFGVVQSGTLCSSVKDSSSLLVPKSPSAGAEFPLCRWLNLPAWEVTVGQGHNVGGGEGKDDTLTAG